MTRISDSDIRPPLTSLVNADLSSNAARTEIDNHLTHRYSFELLAHFLSYLFERFGRPRECVIFSNNGFYHCLQLFLFFFELIRCEQLLHRLDFHFVASNNSYEPIRPSY